MERLRQNVEAITAPPEPSPTPEAAQITSAMGEAVPLAGEDVQAG